jgi:hypothetical protein
MRRGDNSIEICALSYRRTLTKVALAEKIERRVQEPM